MAYSRNSQYSDIYAYASISLVTKKKIFYIHPACNRDGKKLELPFACQTITCDTLQELKEKLLELQGIGYRITKHTFERIDKEINSNDQIGENK